MFIIPWLDIGGADVFNLNLITALTSLGVDVTIVTTVHSTHPWMARFLRITPDVFVLDSFLKLTDYAAFVIYLLQSRRVDVVVLSNSEWGMYFAPMVRVEFPDVAIVDYNHMIEEHWRGQFSLYFDDSL